MIGGYTEPKGSRTGFGALLLGVHDDEGALRYCGNVGTGFDAQPAGRHQGEAGQARQPTIAPSMNPRRAGVKAHWVKPRLVAEVSFGEWTREGRMRHSVFQGLRTDKPAAADPARGAPRTPTPRRRAPTASKAAAKPWRSASPTPSA